MNNARGKTGSTRSDQKKNSGRANERTATVGEGPSVAVATARFGGGARQSRPVFWMHAVSPPLTELPISAVPGDTARAILSEISEHAAGLSTQGTTHSIDLRFLKSMPEEREMLTRLLGCGEVSAIVDSVGCSEIHETAIPCVWWISHLNSDNETVGELIEISTIPELLVGDVTAIGPALEALRAREPFGAH